MRHRFDNDRVSCPDDIPDHNFHSEQRIEPNELYPTTFSNLLRKREYGVTTDFIKTAGLHMIPNTGTEPFSLYDRVYNGRFSPDGNLYYCGSQSDVRIFDTTDPYEWQLLKEQDGIGIRWTVTDMDITPCQRYILYSTIDSHISLINVKNEIDLDNEYKLRYNGNECHEAIQIGGNRGHRFGIWSFKVSGDGREIICGTSQQSLEVFDLVNRENVATIINAHQEDINNVCFANRENSEVVFSGSDDASIKVWDRRTFGAHRNSPEGMLIGHREGITCISSKGDGIHLISNSKDQTLKQWDLRMMASIQEYRAFVQNHRFRTDFDYRWADYPMRNYTKRLAADSSIKTFRGHEVLQTLIRCYYSPEFSTGQRFIYTGSACGSIYIFDALTGKTVNVLQPDYNADVIRDVNWHPTLPIIAYSAFSGTVGCFVHGDTEVST